MQLQLPKHEEPTSSRSVQSQRERGHNATRVRGLEQANKSLKENVEFYKSTAQGFSYKYELMKTRAQDELSRRLNCEKLNRQLQSEVQTLRMMMPYNVLNPAFQSSGFPQSLPVNTTAVASSVAGISQIEKASIDSIELPAALKVRARAPKE